MFVTKTTVPDLAVFVTKTTVPDLAVFVTKTTAPDLLCLLSCEIGVHFTGRQHVNMRSLLMLPEKIMDTEVDRQYTCRYTYR